MDMGRPSPGSSATGSVSTADGPATGVKTVTFLQLTGTPTRTVLCLENPRVGGSIPPQATNKINDLAQPARLGFVVSGLHVATM